MVPVLLGPTAPTVIPLVRKSSSVLRPVVCQVTQVVTSLLALPIQVSLVASNSMPFSGYINGSKIVPRSTIPSAEPSL